MEWCSVAAFFKLLNYDVELREKYVAQVFRTVRGNFSCQPRLALPIL